MTKRLKKITIIEKAESIKDSNKTSSTQLTYLTDTILIIGIIIASLYIWWPTRYLPFWWDSAGFVMQAATNLLKTNFWPVIATNSDFAHPPLIPVLVALLWKTLGEQRLFQHLIMFPFLPLLGISVYYIGRKLINSQLLSIIAAFLSITLPVVVAEYGLIYIDLPSAVLGLAGLSFWLYKRRGMAVVFLCLAVLTKETAIFYLPLLLWWEYLENGMTSLKKRGLLLLTPAFVLLAWFMYHYSATGWWFSENEQRIVSRLPASLGEWFSSLVVIFKMMWVYQAKIFLIVAAVVGLVFLGKTRKSWLYSNAAKAHWGIWLFILATLLFYSLLQEFTPRYAIGANALGIISVLFIVNNALTELKIKHTDTTMAMFGLLLLGLNLANWLPIIKPTETLELSSPADLSYQNMIMVFRQAAVFLELQHEQAIVYGGFPENQHLTQPNLGYVSKKLTYESCDNFIYDKSKEQIVYVHPYSMEHITCLQLSNDYTWENVKRFVSNGKWIELNRITGLTSSPSGELKKN